MNPSCAFKTDDGNVLINTCAKKVKNIIIQKKMGSGTYGEVYAVDSEYNGEKVKTAIKIIQKKITNKNELNEFLKETELEIIYTQKMAELDIGPKIYEAFHTLNNNVLSQFIIMELGDGNLGNLLKDKNIKNNIKNKAFEIAVMKLDQMIKSGMYCMDIKPANFVYKFNDGIDIKIIDFGSDYCYLERIPSVFDFLKDKRTKEKLFFTIMFIQFFVMCYRVNNNKEIYKGTKEIFLKLLKNEKLKEMMLTVLSDNDFGYVFNYYMTDEKDDLRSVDVAIETMKKFYKS